MLSFLVFSKVINVLETTLFDATQLECMFCSSPYERDLNEPGQAWQLTLAGNVNEQRAVEGM